MVWREAEIKTPWSGLGGVNSWSVWSQEIQSKHVFQFRCDFSSFSSACVLLPIWHTVERVGFQWLLTVFLKEGMLLSYTCMLSWAGEWMAPSDFNLTFSSSACCSTCSAFLLIQSLARCFCSLSLKGYMAAKLRSLLKVEPMTNYLAIWYSGELFFIVFSVANFVYLVG